MAAGTDLVRIVIVDDGANSAYRRSPPAPQPPPAGAGAGARTPPADKADPHAYTRGLGIDVDAVLARQRAAKPQAEKPQAADPELAAATRQLIDELTAVRDAAAKLKKPQEELAREVESLVRRYGGLVQEGARQAFGATAYHTSGNPDSFRRQVEDLASRLAAGVQAKPVPPPAPPAKPVPPPAPPAPRPTPPPKVEVEPPTDPRPPREEKLPFGKEVKGPPLPWAKEFPTAKPVSQYTLDKERREREKERAEKEDAAELDRAKKLIAPLPKAAQVAAGAFGGSGGFLGKVGEAAGAGGAGGMAGIAAAAGGPVALAMMAVKAVQAAGDGLRAGIEGAGAAAGKLAKNDMTVLTDATHAAGEALGKVSPVAGEVVKTFATLVSAVGKAATAFTDRGKELAQQGVSGELVVANVRADLRKMGADMREAQKLGPSLAKLTDAQSRAETAFQDAIIPLKKAIVEKLTELVEMGAAFVDWIKPYFDLFVTMLGKIFDVIKFMSPAVLLAGTIWDELKAIKDRMPKKADPMPELDKIWERIFSFGKNIDIEPRHADPFQHRFKQTLSDDFGFGKQ